MTDLPHDLLDTARRVARKYALQNAVQHGKANPGAVIGRVMGEVAELRAHSKAVAPVVNGVVAEVNAMAPEAREAAFRAVESEIAAPKREEPKGPLKPLPNAEKGKVVMRFAPNPSGPFTLGHARGMVVNWTYKEMYDGKLILRFDDTDSTVKPPMPEAYHWMPEDFRWLCGAPDRTFRASERMDPYYAHAAKGLAIGALYVCTCEAEAFRAMKEAKEPCPHRAQTPEENRALWEKMLDGTFKRGEAAVRVKTDIAHPNAALRDWVALRIAEEPHPLAGDKYRVWPLLDFQSAIDDHLEGVTHIIRGKDLMDSTRKQAFLYEHFGWKYPETLYWGRVSVHEFGKFSKSILKDAIARGEFEGWDDPRLPTLRALKRRGFQPEAIRSFWLSFGLTEKDVSASMATLEAENKKVVEARANRYFFVPDPVEIHVTGVPELRASAPLHPDHPQRGAREHRLAAKDGKIALLLAREDQAALGPGAKVRLKDLANVTFTSATEARYEGNDLEFLRQPGAKIVQWAPVDGVRARVKMPDAAWSEGVAERDVLKEAVGSVVQFERVGFARVDAVRDGEAVLYYAHK